MANIAAANIFTRIREVLEDGAGSVRTITAARFSGGLYSGLGRDAETLRSLGKPRVEAEIVAGARHPSSPPINGSFELKELRVTVRIVRSGTLVQKLDDDARDAAKALAVVDADLVSQALTFPGNLTTTAGGGATGIVSGLLRYESSDFSVEYDGDVSARIVTSHEFIGVVNVTLATS